MKNYFDHKTAAKRYKTGRPNFHALVVEHIKLHLGIENKLGVCLDVACGTGMLTEALLEISESVIGIDNSEGMLGEAPQNPNIKYILGKAEDLTVIDGLVDLITVSSAFHWFDQASFLKAAYLKLMQGGCLAIHNNFFTSTSKDANSDALKNWMTNSYLKKFVKPKRNIKPVTTAEIKSIGFELTDDDKFENIVSFNIDGLTNYLVTQSNVIANVELGNYTIAEVEYWLKEELEDHFKKLEQRNFIFGNHIMYFKKIQ